MHKSIILAFILLLFVGCNETQSSLEDLDLMKYGMPIKIKAPIGSTVKHQDYGFMKDITVKKDDEYDVQIFSGDAIQLDAVKVKDKLKSDLQKERYFSKLIQEDDHGFIFEKKFNDSIYNLDFRFVKIQGDKEFIFQAGMVGTKTEENIKSMYKLISEN